eukprot:TRINITY_DN68911_c0_g1_i1.p1 TRINITY_DN68911_c0_g1~~TRINITY_DN68911_c0_g1_i1.p1  ORF type:complete len:199 (-),score=23.94 TRINITY_DN68911_c0_g1_i1:14-610(-)
MAEQALLQFLLSPQNQKALSLIKALRNGVVYGTKIRFPHALVMTLLFRNGSLQDKATSIISATKQHAQNLGSFVLLFKAILYLLQFIEGKQSSSHAFLAGVIGGAVVFGSDNPVNMQINLYLLSRIILAGARIGVEKTGASPPKQSFRIFAALVWGIVMWQFYSHRHTLQDSLQSSMTYLYVDSERWNSIRNFLWHNK